MPGIDLVGELPAELQHVTVFSGAIATTSGNPAQARKLIEFLASPASASIIRVKGMETG